MQNEFDRNFCQLFDKDVNIEQLEFKNTNFPYFFIRFVSSIKELKGKELVEKNKLAKGSSFKDYLEVKF
ncbi:unnamed protein product [Meloidogyne enterolobii]|uniref:Uncharacterized protein n=1 Tax=Meloidogyne enterolobii TaxID=390850 RepID=A0ACB0ZNZ6_MELEN